MRSLRALPWFLSLVCSGGLLLPSIARAQTPPPPSGDQEAITDLEAQLKQLKARMDANESGSNKFLLTGYATSEYVVRQGQNRAFDANFNPIFLWKLNDKLLFMAEPEFELNETTRETGVNLEFANLVYFLNDYVTLSAGKFLTPFSTFTERYHPGWINKSVSKPMYATGPDLLVPFGSLGFQVRGAIPMGNARLRYAVWADEGPSLGTEASNAGSLLFEGYPSGSRNNSLKTGGHVWFLPIPNLEVGYARMKGRVGVPGTPTEQVGFTMQEADLTGRLEGAAGLLEIRGEWISQELTPADYSVVPIYGTRRSAGMGQISYRPSTSQGDFLPKLEFVARYDWFNRPEGDPLGFTRKRQTFNVNYWFTASTAFKVGIERTKTEDPSLASQTKNGVLIAFAVGF